MVELMDKKYEKTSKKFEQDMGFKSCDLNSSKETKDDNIFVPNMEKVEGNCENIKGDTYHCTAYIDTKNTEIIKSDCEKED
jgi:hypothetical protein